MLFIIFYEFTPNWKSNFIPALIPEKQITVFFFFYLELLWVPVPINNQPGGQGKPRQGEDGTRAACPLASFHRAAVPTEQGKV